MAVSGVKAKATARSKDRSLRQLLQGECVSSVGAAEGCDLLIVKSGTNKNGLLLFI
jgi:hypothetical protein